MDIPIITQELAERIEQNENDALLSRMLKIQGLPGNPLGVEIRQFGGSAAFIVRGAPHLELSRVTGLSDADIGQIGELLDWFRMQHLNPSIDLSPYRSGESLLRALAERGCYQSRFLTVLYGRPNPEPPSPPAGVKVKEYPPHALDEFASLVVNIDQIPELDQNLWKKVMQAQFEGWRCYVGFVSGNPAAHGVMRVHSGVAITMFAATRPEYRNFGCQTALLRQRIYDAALSQCDLVTCSAHPTSVSQRNQERAGLRVAYTKAVWSFLSSIP